MVNMLLKLEALGGVATLALMSFAPQSSSTVSMPLSSLRADCTLEKRWAGLVPKMPWAAWLTCKDTTFLITHPLNLVRHVDIRDETQALEFVRFFSSAESYDLFRLDGMVEIMATDAQTELRGFNELEQSVFPRHFAAPTARLLPKQESPQGIENGSLCRGKEFEVKRVTLWPDQTVRELVEVVCDDGFYNNISQVILLNDAGKIGLIYLWPN